MSELVFWPILIALGAIAIGATLKAVGAMAAKKTADDECTHLRAQLRTFNNHENEKPLNEIPIYKHKAGDLIIKGGDGGNHGDGGPVNLTGGTYKAGDA